jgi:hypothetical protein
MYATTLTIRELAALGFPVLDLSMQGTDNRDRDAAPLGIVAHTPSVTFARKVRDAFIAEHGRAPTPAELDVAAARRFDRSAYIPNYLIGTTALIAQLDLDHQRAQHSGMLAADCPAGDVYKAGTWREWASPSDGSGWQRHGRDGRIVYDYWDAAFPGARSPYDVFVWGRYPNNCIGIDLLPDPDTGAYTPDQRRAFVALTRALAPLHGFPIRFDRVTTHTYTSPVERGTVRLRGGTIIGKHWDPDLKVWPHAEVVREAAA